MMQRAPEVTAMGLYLMQHGQATTDAENPERPLTGAAGRLCGESLPGLGPRGVRVGHCVHSGKLRAELTARLLVSEIGAESSVEARPGLAPDHPAAPTAQWLHRVSEHQRLAL